MKNFSFSYSIIKNKFINTLLNFINIFITTLKINKPLIKLNLLYLFLLVICITASLLIILN